MDEFLHYQPIACWDYPLNHLNIFREGCLNYGLKIAGMKRHLPLRSYGYIGSSQGILYYQLFKIWTSPDSARLMGLIMLALQSFLVWRIFAINGWFCFLGLLLFFPYAFQHFVDTGPISFQTTSIFLICYLTKRWRMGIGAGEKGTWKFATGIGFLIFWGIWTKLVYFAILPEILILMSYFFLRRQESQKNPLSYRPFLQDLGWLLLSAGIPLTVLFSSIDMTGKRYYQILNSGQDIPWIQKDVLWQHFSDLSKYFTNPLQSTHRIFDVQATVTLSGITFLILIAFFIGIGIWRLISKGKSVSFIVLNCALFMLGFFWMMKYHTVWAMHHIVLIYPFLLLAIFDIIARLKEKRILGAFLIVFAIINGSLYYSLTKEKIRDDCHPTLNRLNDWLNKNYAHDHVFVIIDLGMYYLKALYGPKDPLNFGPQTPQSNLQKILTETHRKAMFIGMDTDMDKNYKEIKPDFDTGPWRVWVENRS